MKLTTNNMKKVISDKFDIDITMLKVTINEGVYNAFCDIQGVNADIRKTDKEWEETLISHLKWQLYL